MNELEIMSEFADLIAYDEDYDFYEELHALDELLIAEEELDFV